MHSIEGALRMTDEINAQFGFERAFGKTNDNADADTKITKFGISFNSDGTTTFFAQLEKSSASQKEYLEKIQEKKAEEKKDLHGAVFKLLDQILHNLLAYLILLVINLLSMYQVAHQFQK